jgi:hypothetical protein
MALAEFAHYLQFVDILMTAIGIMALINMARSAHPMEAQRIKIQTQHIVASAALLVKRGENEVSAKRFGAASMIICMFMEVT